MRKIKDLLSREREPQLIVTDTNTGPMEQRAKECAGVLIDAYFQGKDPITGVELSEELRAAIAPFALHRLSEEVDYQTNLRINLSQTGE